MTNIKISQLCHLGTIDKVIIHSIDLSLYQVSIQLNGDEFYLTNDKGDFVRAFNVLELQKKMRAFSYRQMVLRHDSAYDEMVGMDDVSGASGNRLEVDLGDNELS